MLLLLLSGRLLLSASPTSVLLLLLVVHLTPKGKALFFATSNGVTEDIFIFCLPEFLVLFHSLLFLFLLLTLAETLYIYFGLPPVPATVVVVVLWGSFFARSFLVGRKKKELCVLCKNLFPVFPFLDHTVIRFPSILGFWLLLSFQLLMLLLLPTF